MKNLKTNWAHIILFVVGMMNRGYGGDYLDYSIPEGAVRIGPARDPSSGHDFYNIFPPGMDRLKEPIPAKIGYEEFAGSRLVKRSLYLNGKRHGVQRTWHPNGQLASEEPYNEGVMDGIFRVWDLAGNLTAQFSMQRGTGVKRIYNSGGILVKEEEFKNGRRDGISMELLEAFSLRSLVSTKDGHLVGSAFTFYDIGVLKGVTVYDGGGAAHGPSIEFSKLGIPQEKKWYIRGVEVSEVAYAAKATKDPTLPPYFSDASQYQQLVTPAVREAIDRYQAAPPVKIPLEFDEQGTPKPVKRS